MTVFSSIKKHIHTHPLWTIFFCSLIFGTIATYQNWQISLFSDDWIWLSVSREVSWAHPLGIFTKTFSGFVRPGMTLWFLSMQALNSITPLPQHLASALLFSVVGALVGGIVYRKTTDWIFSLVASGFVIFSAAPAEAWIWYSAVCDLLLGIGMLCVLHAMIDSRRIVQIGLGVFGLLLGLIAKETGVALIPFLFVSPLVFFKEKRVRAAWYTVSGLLGVLYGLWQFSIGLSRGHAVGFSLTKITVIALSWLQALTPFSLQGLNNVEHLIRIVLVCTVSLAFLFVCALFVWRKWWTEAWLLCGSMLFLVPPSILPLEPHHYFLADRYLFVPTVLIALCVGLLLTRIKTQYRLFVLIICGVWMLVSQYTLHARIQSVYVPIDHFMTGIRTSLESYVERTKSIAIVCSFPYDHNPGYIISFAENVFHVHPALISDGDVEKVPDSALLLRWNYEANAFQEIERTSDLCQK